MRHKLHLSGESSEEERSAMAYMKSIFVDIFEDIIVMVAIEGEECGINLSCICRTDCLSNFKTPWSIEASEEPDEGDNHTTPIGMSNFCVNKPLQ